MSTIKYLDSNGLSYLCKKIKSELSDISLTPGPKGDKGNGFYVMPEDDIEYLIECLNNNQINYEGQQVNRDNLVKVLLLDAQNLGAQISQGMAYGLYEYFGGDNYNYYLIDGYLLGNVICEYDGEPASYVSSYEFVKISPEYIKYEAGDNIDINNSTISAKGYTWDAEKNSFAVGKNINTASGNYSFAEGKSTVAQGDYSHTEGADTTAEGSWSHAEGKNTLVFGDFSHVEGKDNTLMAPFSHVEGNSNALFYSTSHAEGSENISHGYVSHIEGSFNTVTGYAAHAEGFGNIASGDSAHVEGGIAYEEGDYKYDVELNSATYNSSTGILECVTTTEIPDDKISSCIAANFHFGTGTWKHNTYWIEQVEKISATSYKLHLHDDAIKCIEKGIKQDPSTIGTIIKLSLIRHGNIASGNSSHAEGFETIASGVASHAEGAKYESNRSTESAGQASHAEGASTYAKADGSHAEGILNIAGRFSDEISTAAQELGISGTPQELAAKLLGYGAHAEGMNNKALGSCSHSEGNATKALANSTHAEGDTTIAFGEASHAEGYNTQAKGNQSHAEGSNTIATGNSAHAEGFSTVASGSFSHTEGSHTEATGRDSHAEGAYNKAIGIASHAEGEYTTAQGVGSHAEGFRTVSYGDYSHTEGEDAKAYGYGSHAEGCGYNEPETQEIVIKKFINEDYLDNVYSYTGIDFNYFTGSDIGNILNGTELYAPSDTGLENAIGEIAVAKYIEGYGDTMPTGMYLKIYFYNNIFDTLPNQDDGKLVLVLSRSGSYGECSHSEGEYTNAQGYTSHTEGSYTTANGYAAHAEGEETVACAQASHAEGYNSISYGNYSHTEGYFNTSGGEASHTEGSTNIARGEASHAEGIENKALGDYSHAEGSGSIASGTVSHSEGIYTIASGDYSHAEGSCTIANKMGSHAEGYETKANGIDSHAEGWNTITYGFASHTEGECTITHNSGEHAEGRYNISNHDSTDRPERATISSIGIGTDEDNRANAVEVMQNGDMYIYGVGAYDGTNPSSADTVQSILSDLTNNTAGYITEIPVASSTVLGGIKVGENLHIDTNGKLTARGYTWDIESSTMTVNGQINATLGFYETSDARKKNIIDELPLDKAYELINNCQSIIYTLKDSTDKQQIGLIAQEVQQYFPEVVSEDKDGYLSLDYAKLTAIIFRVLKDIIDRVSKLENK